MHNKLYQPSKTNTAVPVGNEVGIQIEHKIIRTNCMFMGQNIPNLTQPDRQTNNTTTNKKYTTNCISLVIQIGNSYKLKSTKAFAPTTNRRIYNDQKISLGS